MIIEDDKHLMMIEPQNPAAHKPIDDELTAIAEKIWKQCEPRGSAYKGCHECIGGVMSDNRDHYTPMGRKTNSLLVYYVRFHRDEIPNDEIEKLLNENTLN